jgi:hypothetical protein
VLHKHELALVRFANLQRVDADIFRPGKALGGFGRLAVFEGRFGGRPFRLFLAIGLFLGQICQQESEAARRPVVVNVAGG